MPSTANDQKIKQFSYPCTQAIFYSLDANLRAQLSVNCSGLRSADLSVPLKCHHLRFDEADLSTEINGVSWNVGIFMKYPQGKLVPHLVREMNGRNGLNCDINNKGRRDWSTIRTLKPGDIAVFDSSRPTFPDQASEGFTPYIMLRVGDITKERVLYNKSLLDAQRYLNTRLFGNRNGPVLVKRLTVAAETLRLPEGVKFQVKELDLALVPMEALDDLAPILAPASYPLDLLRIVAKRNAQNHPAVKSARCFCALPLFREDLLELLTSLNNTTIITTGQLITVKEYLTLIQDWTKNKRPVGSSLTFETHEEDQIEKIFGAMMKDLEYRENEIGETFIPLTRSTALKITAGEDKGEIAQELRKNGHLLEFCFLKMEVVYAEHEIVD